MVDLANIINLAKTASGLLLNQKNIAFFKEDNYSEGNGLLNMIGIDTNTVLGGVFSGTTEEILVGGKSAIDNNILNAVIAWAFENEPIQADGGSSVTAFTHPLEWNVSDSTQPNAQNFIADHSIRNPDTFTAMISTPNFFYTEVFNELNDLLNKQTLCAIVAKGRTYRNMTLRGFYPSYTVEKMSRIVVNTNWQETQMVYPMAKQSGVPTS